FRVAAHLRRGRTNKCLAESNKSRTGAAATKTQHDTLTNGLGDTMTKPKTWAHLALSLDADFPDLLADLVAEARAMDWNFTAWCYANGYDADNPVARNMFECLLVYAKLEGRAGLQ